MFPVSGGEAKEEEEAKVTTGVNENEEEDLDAMMNSVHAKQDYCGKTQNTTMFSLDFNSPNSTSLCPRLKALLFSSASDRHL